MSKIGTEKLKEILEIFKSMTCEEYDVLFKMLDEKKPFVTCIKPLEIIDYGDDRWVLKLIIKK